MAAASVALRIWVASAALTAAAAAFSAAVSALSAALVSLAAAAVALADADAAFSVAVAAPAAALWASCAASAARSAAACALAAAPSESAVISARKVSIRPASCCSICSNSLFSTGTAGVAATAAPTVRCRMAVFFTCPSGPTARTVARSSPGRRVCCASTVHSRCTPSASTRFSSGAISVGLWQSTVVCVTVRLSLLFCAVTVDPLSASTSVVTSSLFSS